MALKGIAPQSWNTRMGVILAVAGSAVGLGNFLRFPGQVAEYGGGAFMIAYFIGFILVGLPVCWVEWTMGRRAGRYGFNSCPSILAVIAKHPVGKYLGILGLLIPTIIYMYYVYIESWCLGYAFNFARGALQFESTAESADFFKAFIGQNENGSALGFGLEQVGLFLVISILINFFLIWRGLNKGIEWFCKYAMPTLVLLAIALVIQVLTLGTPDANKPDNNISKGLGFMWNPEKTHLEKRDAEGNWLVVDMLLGEKEISNARELVNTGSGDYRIRKVTIRNQLMRGDLWLAAVGQIFFSLSVGFGVILTYSSYLRRTDDVVLSGLAASSANEVCEVALGGMITIPAAVAFLGVAGIAGMTSTFGLGFNVLPMVFSSMGTVDLLGLTISLGHVTGAAFFFLLFLAAVTSSLSMLQPGIAFLEEYLMIDRKRALAILGTLTTVGTAFVVYFSHNLTALATMDFWIGTMAIFILATIQIILFGWVFGAERGMKEAKRGSIIAIPRVFYPVFKYIAPIFLIGIFILWIQENLFGTGEEGEWVPSRYVTNLFGETSNWVAQVSVGWILICALFFFLVIRLSPLGFPFQKIKMDNENLDEKEDL